MKLETYDYMNVVTKYMSSRDFKITEEDSDGFMYHIFYGLKDNPLEITAVFEIETEADDEGNPYRVAFNLESSTPASGLMDIINSHGFISSSVVIFDEVYDIELSLKDFIKEVRKKFKEIIDYHNNLSRILCDNILQVTTKEEFNDNYTYFGTRPNALSTLFKYANNESYIEWAINLEMDNLLPEEVQDIFFMGVE